MLIQALPFIVIGICVSLLNWVYFFMDWSNRRKHIDTHVSMIPLFGALFITIGLLVFKDEPTVLWLLPLMDIGTVNMLYMLLKMSIVKSE